RIHSFERSARHVHHHSYGTCKGGASAAPDQCHKRSVHRAVGHRTGFPVLDDTHSDGGRVAVCISRQHGRCASGMAVLQTFQETFNGRSRGSHRHRGFWFHCHSADHHGDRTGT